MSNSAAVVVTSAPSTAVATANWLWEKRNWIAGGAAALATLRYLRTLQNPRHLQADAATLADAQPCPTVEVDRSLFPSLIPCASVPGLQLYTRVWRVQNPLAIVFMAHGAFEHCGRYEALAAAFNHVGASVYALDHQGHGQSGGDRAHVERFEHYVVDFLHFVQRVQQSDEFSGSSTKPPCFLFGHSMGGLIASHVMQASYTPAGAAAAAASSSSSSSSTSFSPSAPASALQQVWRGRLWPWAGCILSSPALAPNPRDATPVLLAAAGWLSANWPKLQVTGLDNEGISRTRSVVAQYKADPLCWHGRMRARWGHEMLQAMRAMEQQVAEGQVGWPMLVIQGSHDTLVHAPGAPAFVARAKSADKTLKTFEGGWHELLMDTITQQEATTDIMDWMQQRIAKNSNGNGSSNSSASSTSSSKRGGRSS